MKQKIVLRRVNKDLTKEYLNNLKIQFRSATGYDKRIVEDDMFLDWLIGRDSILSEYRELLKCLDFKINHPHTAELGKGFLDSVVMNKDQTTIITPYSYGLNRFWNSKVIKGKLDLVGSENQKNDIKNGILTSNLDGFITQNPYSISELELFKVLCDLYKYKIVLGVYGNDKDLDKDKKIRMLQEFKKQLSSYNKDEYIRINNDYFYVITTKTRYKVKEKRLVR